MGQVRECKVCGRVEEIRALDMCSRDYYKHYYRRRNHTKAVRRHVPVTDLIEDLEDLTLSRSEIETRLGVKWRTAYRALLRAERYDLIEKVQKASE